METLRSNTDNAMNLVDEKNHTCKEAWCGTTKLNALTESVSETVKAARAEATTTQCATSLLENEHRGHNKEGQTRVTMGVPSDKTRGIQETQQQVLASRDNQTRYLALFADSLDGL
ncbi:hypothetical protein TRVL_07464 [Trypanosoma vivax]|nr:hypothetical protein TRVL_07464 [Trypanosoma vivax]